MSNEKIVATFEAECYSVRLVNDDGDRLVRLTDEITPYSALLSIGAADKLAKALGQAVDSSESLSLQEAMVQFQKRFPVGTQVVPRDSDGSGALTVMGHCVRFGVVYFVFVHENGGNTFSPLPAQNYIRSDGGSNV